MNPIIKPVYKLMNRLSFRNKFMLIASVFALPLAVFAAQLAYTYHQKAEQAEFTQSGLTYLKEATLLLQDLELLRDISVVVSWRSNSFLSKEVDQLNKKVYRRTVGLMKLAPHELQGEFLEELKNSIEKNGLIKGNESERIDGVYEDAHILLRKGYSWRSKLAYEYVSSEASGADIRAILNMLNDSESVAYALGMVRTFGTLYLDQKFVESHGVDALEKAYRLLSQRMQEVEVKNKEYQTITEQFPHVRYDQVGEALSIAQEMLYQNLIEALAPSENVVEFYQELSRLYQVQYDHNEELFKLAGHLTSRDYDIAIERLSMFYLSVLLISILILYLTAGFYHSVGVAISGLSKSASLVAAGDYEKPIAIDAKDELAMVAGAMDQMRISIKEREEKLELMSQTDGLTQLYNRPFFDKAIELSLANSRRNKTPLSLVMLDIDHFKAINDTYGHQIGDDCLIEIASLLKQQYQRQTDIIARYGGEEFIVILYGQTLDEAVEQTEKLRQAIEKHITFSSGKEISFTASFGVAAMTPPTDLSSQALIGLADELLYKSKANGRNQISALEATTQQDYDNGSLNKAS